MKTETKNWIIVCLLFGLNLTTIVQVISFQEKVIQDSMRIQALAECFMHHALKQAHTPRLSIPRGFNFTNYMDGGTTIELLERAIDVDRGHTTNQGK